MTLAVQQSLFEVGGAEPMVESARWIEGVMLSDIALGVCIVAVAFLGALMLTGRLPLRDGARVVIGCFVLLGAPVIAAGFVSGGSALIQLPSPPPNPVSVTTARPDLPPSDFDPYAGASLRTD